MKTPRFRYLPHTADASFIAYGKSEKSLINNAALALLELMLDIKLIKKSKSKSSHVRISESADSLEDLVWFTLQKVLSTIDAEKLNAYSFRVVALKRQKNGKFHITAKLFTKKINGDFALLSVKAVTPHNLSVKKTSSGYSATIVVDV